MSEDDGMKSQTVMCLEVASKLGLPVESEPAFVKMMYDKFFPKGNGSKQDFYEALVVTREYGLNPFKNEIYVLPTKAGLKPSIGIDGWIRIAQEHPENRGWTFDEHNDEDGNLISITCTLKREGWPSPVKITEYLIENKMGTDLWVKRPRRMLRHRALAQAVREVYGVTGIYHDVEMGKPGEPAEEIIKPTSSKVFDSKADELAEKIAPQPEPVEPKTVAELDAAVKESAIPVNNDKFRNPTQEEMEEEPPANIVQTVDGELVDADTGEVYAKTMPAGEPEFTPAELLGATHTPRSQPEAPLESPPDDNELF